MFSFPTQSLEDEIRIVYFEPHPKKNYFILKIIANKSLKLSIIHRAIAFGIELTLEVFQALIRQTKVCTVSTENIFFWG